jgi:hypothetical protein
MYDAGMSKEEEDGEQRRRIERIIARWPAIAGFLKN